MSHQFSPNIEQLIRQKMSTGLYSSEDELLSNALQALDHDEEELRAIQEGLQSLDEGKEGVSVEEAFQRVRRNQGRGSGV